MRSVALAVLVLALGAPGAAGAQEARGFAEVRASFFIGADGTVWQLVERARPTFEAPIGDRVRLVATVEAGLAQGRDTGEEVQAALEGSDLGPLLDLAGCEWTEPRNRLLRIDDADDYLDVDRLYLDVYLPKVDLRIGRQSIHWGSATFLNPTDPFPELLLGEPWRPRRGLNAARASVALPGNADLTAVLATSDAFDAFRAAGRARITLKAVDLAVSGAWRSDGGEGGEGDGLVGLDVRGTLGVGFWVEAALHLASSGEDRVHERIAAGIDYSFPVLDGLVVLGQYYRNGAGAGPGDEDQGAALSGISGGIEAPTCAVPGAAEAFEAGPADPFALSLRGRDYLLLGATMRFLPEVSLGLMGLQNLSDGTGLLVPTLTVLPLGWLEISASAQVPLRLWGGGGEFRPAPEDLVISADLGAPLGAVTADLSGLFSDATLTVWTRVSF
ncbi:hypothetical protein L6R50_04990 [Myxococcota bacterium]|nr:hypothetical protein [Myxococcota bacterium]